MVPERKSRGRGGVGALYSHMAVSPCGKKVFLTLNSKIAKCLSISGRSVIAKSNTGGGEGKSEALGTRQAKLLEGRVHGMNSSNSHRHKLPEFPDHQEETQSCQGISQPNGAGGPLHHFPPTTQPSEEKSNCFG